MIFPACAGKEGKRPEAVRERGSDASAQKIARLRASEQAIRVQITGMRHFIVPVRSPIRKPGSTCATACFGPAALR